MLRFALLSALLLATSDALQVTSSAVQAMDPTEPHRMLQQYYTVGQDTLDDLINHEALQTLKISIPGRVFVSYNHNFGATSPTRGPSQAATVRISGNSEDIFDFFEVVATSPHIVEVRRRANVHGTLDEVYMLTEISVAQPHKISQIISTGPADLVIEDGVVISDLQSTLRFKLDGSGNIFMDTRSSTLAAAVEVTCSSSGDFYWTMSSLQTSSYKLSVAGSGDFNLFADSLDITKTELALAGSGASCIEPSSFRTDTLNIASIGSGQASISTSSGHCNSEEIDVFGSGDVMVGTMLCTDVKVNGAGSGDFYVQASHSISGSVWGSGDVKYVGNRPEQISDRHDAKMFSTDQKKKYKAIATPAGSSHDKPCRPGVFPPREAVMVTMSSALSSSVGLGPLIFFALISLCYLRSQRKQKRPRAPRFGHAAEMHPLMTSGVPPLVPPMPHQSQQQLQQQQQQQQNQVYV